MKYLLTFECDEMAEKVVQVVESKDLDVFEMLKILKEGGVELEVRMKKVKGGEVYAGP